MDDFIVRMEMETFMGVNETYKIQIALHGNEFIICNHDEFVRHPRESLTKEFRKSIQRLVDAFLQAYTASKVYVQDKKPLRINLTDRRLPVADLVRYVYNYVYYDFTKWIAKLPPIVPPAPKHALVVKRDYARDYGLPFAFIDVDTSA